MARILSDMGEFGWLKTLLPRLYWPPSLNSQLCIGPGDDAGVLRLSPHRVLVATTDALVEGIHFERKWLSPRDLGEKLLAVNLSDLAAMGAVKPVAALVTVAFPGDTPVDFVDKFYKGLRRCAQRWKVGFLGGDTVGSRRDMMVSATLLGEADPRHLVQRGGAKAGDIIGTIGPLGLAAGGLEVLQKGFKEPWTAPLIKAFCQPQPQFTAGSLLAKKLKATSLIDASDGLEASVRLIAEGSRLGAELHLDTLRVHPALTRWAAMQKKDPFTYVLRGGEDYALVFTVPPSAWPQLKRKLPTAQKIGRMVAARQDCWAFQGNRKMSLTSYGYAHFKS